MADNPPGEKSSRQKIIAVIVVIVVLIVIWQVIGLFSGGSSAPPPTITPVKTNMNAAAPSGAAQPQNPPPAAAQGPGLPLSPAPGATGMPQNQTPADQFREATVGLNPELADVQKETEQKYIDQLNQLQSLKIQREIAETNQAIAAAKLATVTAEKNVSELLTKPTTPPPLPLTGIVPPSGTVIMGPPAPTPPPSPPVTPVPPPPPEIKYRVISIAMQLGRWSAVIESEGKLYNVMVGDILPPDNSRVVSINKNYVTLLKNKKTRMISMVPTIDDEPSVQVVIKK